MAVLNIPYTYRAQVVRIVDGDTIDLDFDLGFGCHKIERVRLSRIDAWEVRGNEKERGKLGTLALQIEFLDSPDCIVETIKDKKDKYGRYLAEVYKNGVNLNDWLVKQGHAEYEEY